MDDPWDDLYYGTGAFLITPSGMRIPVGDAGPDLPLADTRSRPTGTRARGGTAPQALAGARYRGVGPKGYRRTDQRIHDDVCDRMLLDPYLDASGIVVGVSKGHVTLTGSVPSVRMRESAVAAADRIAPGAVRAGDLKVVAGSADSGPQVPAGTKSSRARGPRKLGRER